MTSPRLAFALATLLVGPLAAADPKPNFVFINIDDLGYADVGPFGSKINRTPNLDRMAREGRKLTTFYAAPVCSPSRAALMTGCYPKRCLPIPHVLFPGNDVGLSPNEVTVAEVLKAAGLRHGHRRQVAPRRPAGVPAQQAGLRPALRPAVLERHGPGRGRRQERPRQAAPEAEGPGPAAAAAASQRDGGQAGASGRPAVARRAVHRPRPWGSSRTTRTSRSSCTWPTTPSTSRSTPARSGPGSRRTASSRTGWRRWTGASAGSSTLSASTGCRERTLVIFTSDNGGTPRSVNAPLRGHKGEHVRGRRAGARHRLVAGQDPGRHGDRRGPGDVRHPADVRGPGRRQGSDRPHDRRGGHLAAPRRGGGREAGARDLLLLPRAPAGGRPPRRLEAARRQPGGQGGHQRPALHARGCTTSRRTSARRRTWRRPTRRSSGSSSGWSRP